MLDEVTTVDEKLFSCCFGYKSDARIPVAVRTSELILLSAAAREWPTERSI